jgi:hypothetical protein
VSADRATNRRQPEMKQLMMERLKRLLWLRGLHAPSPADTNTHLLAWAIFSTIMDCATLGVGDVARQLERASRKLDD